MTSIYNRLPCDLKTNIREFYRPIHPNASTIKLIENYVNDYYSNWNPSKKYKSVLLPKDDIYWWGKRLEIIGKENITFIYHGIDKTTVKVVNNDYYDVY